ncbi:ABC transporter permease [Clostridium sp. C8]|uniref:Lipoprotein-releasing system transmembrane protein LolE n=1 Tax=bioreactor metagenome TaxID=1076179 RepID=A0A644X0Y7_9ZZZZ|nr:ABC transporter permease [Clostridium sp. C8]KLE14787.1 permease [Clostridium sp. C8]
MTLPFKIAVRFLKSSKGQTTLIALGIAVGVSVQIFIGSLIQGLQKSLINKTIGNSSQVTISSNTEDKFIKDYSKIIDKIKTSDSRIINISVASDVPALVNEDEKNYSVLVRGMNIEDSDKIYNIKKRIYEGREPKSELETIIGKELQQELGAKIGDKLQIITNSGEINELTITGFYNLNVASINKSWMITTLETSQRIFSLDNRITGIEMQVNEVFKADEIASKLIPTLDNNFKVDNWKAQNAELLSGLNGQSISSIMIQVFVLISVSLAIASILAITVIQKSKQIGILKAMGIKDRSASLIFLFQGLLLGVMGAILGVLLGLLLGVVFTKFALNPDGTPVVDLYIDYGFIALSAIIALISATVASLIPAKRSSKLNPIEVIRNG